MANDTLPTQVSHIYAGDTGKIFTAGWLPTILPAKSLIAGQAPTAMTTRIAVISKMSTQPLPPLDLLLSTACSFR